MHKPHDPAPSDESSAGADEGFAPELWSGRAEPSGSRYFQAVRAWHSAAHPEPSQNKSPLPQVVLVGFACDEGVRRNFGRVGARHGPRAFRTQLAKLPFRLSASLRDAGDIVCNDGNLETACKRMKLLMTRILGEPQALPVVIGGGHEVAWPSYLSLAANCRKQGLRLGVINFDAHFDLRDLIEGQGHSGSAFFQMASDAAAHGEAFQYLCLGIQPLANHDQLFERARSLGVRWVEADSLAHATTRSMTEDFLSSIDVFVMSVCLDVFNHAVAPGVSAPQPLGIMPKEFFDLALPLITSPKLRILEIAELSPACDGLAPGQAVASEPTARFAASLVATLLAARFPRL